MFVEVLKAMVASKLIRQSEVGLDRPETLKAIEFCVA